MVFKLDKMLRSFAFGGMTALSICIVSPGCSVYHQEIKPDPKMECPSEEVGTIEMIVYSPKAVLYDNCRIS